MTQIFYTIYKITNLINNKIYLGKHKTKNLDDGYMGSGKLLLAAQKKYGIGNFKKEILFVFCSEAEMNAKEKELVTESFCNQDNTYNLCVGGQGGFGHINSNDGLRKEKNSKARQNSNAVLLEKYGVTNPGQLPQSKIKTSELSKQRHANGSLQHIYFNKRIDFKEILEKAKSAQAIEKRKETYKKTKHSQGNKNSQFGTMWITNKLENKKIKNTDIIPNGWHKGRVNTNTRD